MEKIILAVSIVNFVTLTFIQVNLFSREQYSLTDLQINKFTEKEVRSFAKKFVYEEYIIAILLRFLKEKNLLSSK